MSNALFNENENENVPAAYAMWEVFYSTITPMFKDVEVEENNLRIFVKTILNSDEFVDTIVPKYAHLTKKTEKQYEAFTTWLIGRLFYLLTYEKLGRSHDLFIELQLKILDILRAFQPHIHQKMLEEYSNLFIKISDHIDENEEKYLKLKCFTPENSLINPDGLDFNSEIIEITSRNNCLALQKYLLKILTNAVFHSILCGYMVPTTTAILENFISCLEKAPFESKIHCISFFTNILNGVSSEFSVSNDLVEYYAKFVNVIEQLVYLNEFLSVRDSKEFVSALNELLKALFESKVLLQNPTVRNSVSNLCNFYVKTSFKKCGKEFLEQDAFLILICKVLNKILEQENSNFKNINKLIEYTVSTQIFSFPYILIERQILKEINCSQNDDCKNLSVLHASETWRNLHDSFMTILDSYLKLKINIIQLNDFLNMMSYIFRMIQNVFVQLTQRFYKKEQDVTVTFLDLSEFLIKCRQLKEYYLININKESLESLELLVKSYELLFPILQFKRNEVTECEIMIYYICFPFIGEVNFPYIDSNLENSLKNTLPQPIKMAKQIERIKILSSIMFECSYAEWKNFVCITTWIKNIFVTKISNFLKNPKSIPKSDLTYLFEIIENLPILIGSWKDGDIISEIVIPLLRTQNSDILRVLTKNMEIIICETIGPRSISRKLSPSENDGYFKVYCTFCDSIRNDEELIPVPHFKNSVLENQISTFVLMLFSTGDVEIKRNLAKMLPKISKHLKRFYTKEVTDEWLKWLVDGDKELKKIMSGVFSSTLQNMQEFEDVDQTLKKELLKSCLNALVDLMLNNYTQKNHENASIALDLLQSVGKLKKIDKSLLVVCRILIIYLIRGNNYLSKRACIAIQEIATAHNTTPKEIFTKYKKQFCLTMAGMTTSVKNSDISMVMKGVLNAFESKIEEFFSYEGQHIIPCFVVEFVTSPNSKRYLNDIAELLRLEPSEILLSNFSYIYSYIYLNETPEIFEKSMKFVQEVTKTSIKTLCKRNLQVIYYELLMHFHDKKDLVLKAIYELAKESSEQSIISSSLNIQEIADNLNPRFLGVLVYFELKLVSKRVCEEVKIDVLMSMPNILKLMGPKYITPLRYKVLATLRTALTLTEEPFLELTCNIWDAFIRSCDPESLGPMLSVIFITLLPLRQTFPMKISSIFRYLLIENQEKVRENIPDLFFLQDTNVGNEFKTIVERFTNATKPNSFLEELNTQIKYITHENMEVRVYGLNFLKKMLAGKRLELNELILGNNGMSWSIVELIDILITGCRDNEEKIKLACCDCIGELGAIEPSHFPRKYTMTDSNFNFYITDPGFVKNALLELIRVFQTEEHTLNMNRYALAIQEILKVYGVSPDKSAPNYEIWEIFPDDIKELMLPLLSSRYTISITTDEKITSHPIYGSNYGSSFKDWLYNWTSYLITLVKNDKQSLLEVCKPSLKQDFKTLMFFLPHILVHAILDATEEEKNLIHAEFLAVLTSNNEKKLDPALMQFRPLKYKDVTLGLIEHDGDNNQGKYMQVIFVLLDYLDRWLKEWESNSKPRQSPSPISNTQYQSINKFMEMFCKLMIAKCNFMREEYPRALLYLEKYVQEDKSRLNDQLGFFIKIYAELEEPDGVAGAMAMHQKEPCLEDMIVAHGVAGQFQDMAACYERMAQEQMLKPEYLQDMIKCYLELDNPYTAFNIAEGAIEKEPNYKSMFYESQAEALWRLNSYDSLEELVSNNELKNNTDWGVSIGKSLLHFKNGERANFNEEISTMRKNLANMFTVTSIEEGVYRHGYPNIIKLHILNELQKSEEMIYNIKDVLDKSKCEEAINNLMEEWDLRLKTIQASGRVFEPVLRLRRIILEQSQHILKSENVKQLLNQHIAKYWLKSAEIARTANNFQQAYIYILQAERYKPKELFIEKAKLYWAKEEQELAFATLKRGIEEHFPDASSFQEMNPTLRKTDRKLCAEAKLLIATYNDETANVGMEANIKNYKEVVDTYKEWEKSLVCLAQYYDKLFSNMNVTDRDAKGGEILLQIMNCFGKSLQYGSTYIYQSMPRMLSIWFDYGTRVLESAPTDDNASKETKKRYLCTMIKLMDGYLDRLPAYMFLSAFSQLVSRICHPVREVYIQIKAILIKLILRYPQQSMWMIMAVSKSAYAMRTKRCQEVLQDQHLKNSHIMRLIYDFNRLAEKLIELCNKQLSDGITTTSVNTVIRMLPRLLQGNDFSKIILPIQKLRKLILPNPEISSSEHNPFPNHDIYIVGIEDEIQVLQSLQRPRKITFRGSDGKKYIHMLKPKDDLRKDTRLMEFNDVVNLYLHRDGESRQKRLYIRTYSVVPLNEECGIIEWVDNLIPLRPILMTMYKQKGLYVGARELKSLMCQIRDPLTKKRQVFEEKLLPRHPPVLSEWFRRKFPDAHHWYQARTAFIRTSAVMSMAGYILGLGDRHGENILLDSTNGDVVHVDFNCLFNKGENFDWPERVPFRLTHNMIEAMGPLGVEGIFRKSCAVTLRVLRTHTDTLMSIVRPFVYDPLVSWPRNHPGKSELNDAERTNEQAVEHIRNIELRLQGSYRSRGKTYSVPLSCEGQANNLIAEATSVDNLCQMYIGWGPFL